MKESNKNTKQKMNITDFWQDKNHKDLLFYLVIAIFILELIVGITAFFYSIINAIPGENGNPPRFQFPMLAYAIIAVVAPAILLLIVHLLGIGLFRSLKRSSVDDDEWRQNLPERLRKVYIIIQGAPTALLLVGIVALGIALFYIDGAMSAILRLGSALEGYLVWIIGGIALVWCITYISRIWFKYRVKKLESEYQYRREIFERSGIVIVDRNCIQLPPSVVEINANNMIESGQNELIGISENALSEKKYNKDNSEHIGETIEVKSLEDEAQDINSEDDAQDISSEDDAQDISNKDDAKENKNDNV